jgi:hypothetical protein
MEGYDKHIRRARITLLIVAGWMLVHLYTIWPIDNAESYISAVFLVLVSGAFVALAFWTKKKPYTALLLAMVLFIALIVLDAVVDLHTIYQGWIWKIAIIVSLVLGLQNAREAQQLLRAFGKDK